jgi:hypothetical protein
VYPNGEQHEADTSAPVQSIATGGVAVRYHVPARIIRPEPLVE